MKRILLLLVTLCLFSCNSNTDKRPLIVSTTGMVNDIVKNIAGNQFQTVSLMGPGVDPHLYKASAGDLKTLTDAQLIFYNGLHLELKMIDIFEKMSQTKPTVAITKQISKKSLLSSPDYEGLHDPHIWFDVTLWIEATRTVTDALIEFSPTHRETFTKNSTAYIKQLTELNQWISEQINQIPSNKRILVTAHDAFGYFGKAYGFRVVGLQGISTASEAGTKDIQNTAKIIIDNQVPTIFIESSVPVRKIQALQAAVQATGGTVQIGETLFTDAMGDPTTEEGTYIGMIRHNINSIVKGLK